MRLVSPTADTLLVQLYENGADDRVPVNWLPLRALQPRLDCSSALVEGRLLAGATLRARIRINWAGTFSRLGLELTDYTCRRRTVGPISGIESFEFLPRVRHRDPAPKEPLTLKWDPNEHLAQQGEVLTAECEELHIPARSLDMAGFVRDPRCHEAEHRYLSRQSQLSDLRGECSTPAEQEQIARLLKKWSPGSFVHLYCPFGNPVLEV